MTADEPAGLLALLDGFRDTLHRQTDGLDAEQLRTRHEPSTLTLGGLLKHLAFVENFWVRHIFSGGDRGEPWSSVDWSKDWGWEFRTAADQTPQELRALYDAEVAACDTVVRRALDAGGLDSLAGRRHHGQDVSLRFVQLQVIQEYARHCGHADLIRESIDGAVGL